MTADRTTVASVCAGMCTAQAAVLRRERNKMADLVLVLVVLGFFGLCLLYVRGCDRIIRTDENSDPTAEPAPAVAQR